MSKGDEERAISMIEVRNDMTMIYPTYIDKRRYRISLVIIYF